MSDEKRLSLSDLTYGEIAAELTEYPKFRAEQVYFAVQNNKSYEEMSNVPKQIRDKLSKKYFATATRIKEVFKGKDGTEKYLYELNDGNIIEGVFMPHNYGNTLCISTQVGCRMGCAFCASTLNGLVRNLSAGEMLAEVYAANIHAGGTRTKRAITNIVLMGSGEPLDNYDEVIKFLREISNENNLSVSLRNISLSTCGLVDKIILLADSGLTVTLTISLHAADDETRLKIMPIAKKWKIKEVIDAAKYYFEKTGRRIIFEYSLIEGVNSSKKDAANLANIVSGLNCHINLIKLNYVKERGMSGADKDTVKAFMETLTAKKISNTLRRSMGNDIMGACGQLRNSYTKTEVAKN